jgi:hypothetical protein
VVGDRPAACAGRAWSVVSAGRAPERGAPPGWSQGAVVSLGGPELPGTRWVGGVVRSLVWWRSSRPLSLSNVCSNRVGHGTGLVRPQHTEGLRETPVDVYGSWTGWLPQARDLLATDIGHAMVRMQHAVFADRDGLTSAAGQRWAICWRICGWPLLAAAVTAGAGIADRFRVVMPPGMMIIVDAGA